MTGLAQSGIMYGYALLAVAASQNHAALLEQVQALNLGPALITTAKFAIVRKEHETGKRQGRQKMS